MKIIEFDDKYFTKIAKFWKQINFFAPFDLKWAYNKKKEAFGDLFLIAIEQDDVIGTVWATYDLQESRLVHFAFKKGRTDIGEALLDRILKNLEKRGTLTVALMTRHNQPYEEASYKLAKEKFKFRKIATVEYSTRFLTKADKLH